MQGRHRGSRRWQPPPEKERNKFRINEDITARNVRLIDQSGESIGVVSLEDAMARSEKISLDLVEISPSTDPPVCRIIDYNKFIYQREKKRKEAKKHQKTVQLKEIKFRPQTDVHDYDFKVKHIREFLNHGDKVKITIRFKGRELAFTSLGYEKIAKIREDISDIGKVEADARMEGRTIHMTVGPLRTPVRDGKSETKGEAKGESKGEDKNASERGEAKIGARVKVDLPKEENKSEENKATETVPSSVPDRNNDTENASVEANPKASPEQETS